MTISEVFNMIFPLGAIIICQGDPVEAGYPGEWEMLDNRYPSYWKRVR